MRMYKTHKIHIALGLLALCVVFALLPVFGLAVDQEPCDGDHGGWTKLDNVDQLKAGGNFYLAGDLDLSGAMTNPGAIEIKEDLNLCLNGHKLTLGSNYLKSSGSTYNFGATINICDCAGTGSIESTESTKATIYMEYANLNLWSGTIIGSKSSSKGGGIYMYYGTFNMYDGTITGGEVTYGGGGVYLGYGTFNMYGGSIEENTGGSKGGGGVYIGGGSTCTFNFYDGYIKNNTAGSATDGGGISAGAEFVGLSDVNVNISGGYIIGNDAGRYGGGVYIGGGNFTMSGGTVEKNTAGRHGGGIYMNRNANMSGKITIKGNTVQDAANNLYVGNNRTINVNGPLEAESYIGITMYTPGTFTGTGCGDYIDYFHSDDEGYYVVAGSGGALEIKSLLAVSFTGEGVTDYTVRLASGEKVSEPAPAPTRTGYTFIGWYDDYTGKWDFNTPVTRSMTLTAHWTINAPSSAGMSAEGGKTEGTYDNGNTVVTLNASAPDPAEGITYTYRWYKDGVIVEGQEGSTLELSKAGESGAYKVEIIAKDEDGNESDPVSSDTIEVKIEKATPVITLGSFGEITYGDSLNDIAIPGTAQAGGRDVNGTFSWNDSPDTYPKANSNAESGPAYGITFTPDDGDNYNSAETSTVLIVGKYIIDADSVNVSADDKTYDGTEEAEGTIAISGVANDGDITATGTFTFEDKNAGENKTVYVENIALDDQWTANYELEATSKECKATISQRPVIIQWNYDGPFTYDGREKSVSADIKNLVAGDDCDLLYEGETGTDAKTYNARITGVSDSNYTISGSENLELKWVINKAVFSYTVEENTFTYDGTAKTIEIVQNKGSQQPDCSFSILYDGEASQTDAGTYEAVITITNDNFTFAGGENTAEETLTIYKKNITGTWTGLDKVYDGNKANVGIILSGLAERDEGQEAVITSSTDMTSAGEHEVTATLKNYTITPGSATLKIQPKQVIFTVTDNAAASDGTAKYAEVSVDGLEKDKDFTVYYTDSKGNIVEEPTDAGTYEVWVKITNPDYSHVNGGDDVKVGSLVISKSPKFYQLSFDKNDEDGTAAEGSMEPVSQPGGASVLLPECGYTRDGYTFAGWLYNGKLYQPGELFNMPSRNAAVEAKWDVTYNFSGTVNDENGQPVSDAVVSIWQGANMLDEKPTDSDGGFEFEDLAPGDYNVVIDHNGNKTTTVITISEDGNILGGEIVMSDNISTEVQVTPGSPEIVVDGVDGVFDKSDDVENIDIVISIGQKDLSQLDEDTANTLEDLAGNAEIGLVIDMDITGTIEKTGGESETVEHAVSQENLTITIPLPPELQDKDNYKVVRVGTPGGEGDTLSTKPNENGEYYELSEDKTTIILHVKESGTYAVSSKNNTVKPTYPPIMEESENGSYTLNYPYPTYGQKVTIRPKPDEGYEVNTVIVLDSNGNNVEVTSNEDGTYSYQQPVGSVTIKVTFWKTSGVSDCPKDDTCPLADYKDLDVGEWYHDGIHYCVEEGLMIGTSDDMFEPDAASSRAMVVTILWRMEGSPSAEGTM